MPNLVNTTPPPPNDPLSSVSLIAFKDALKVLGITRPTALEWIAAGALPQPIRPLKGRGRLYYRRADLMRALKEL